MSDIWFISDTHFRHAKCITATDNDKGRPFNSVDEMDAALRDNWNSVVKHGDTVYHLGDILFGHDKGDWLHWYDCNLNGNKHIIAGNHDEHLFKMKFPPFESIHHCWLKLKEHGLLLTHIPVAEAILAETRFQDQQFINVHGHTHGRTANYGNLHFCVSVERINYTPIHLTEVLQHKQEILNSFTNNQ